MTTPDPNQNPYASPAVEIGPQESAGRPAALIALTILACVHLVPQAAVFFLGVANENVPAVSGGLVSCGFYIAIVIGLIKMQEWARILIIWLSYVGIVMAFFVFFSLLLSPLEIITLVFAHWPSVREATKGTSMAKAYTYHELQK